MFFRVCSSDSSPDEAGKERPISRQDSSYGTMKSQSDPTSDTDSYTLSSGSEAPPAYDELFHSKHDINPPKDSLDENSEFGERLI